MANQSTVIAALQADPIPPERECILNGSDIARLIEDFIKVTGLASADPGTPFPSGNNVAAQALATANSALALAQSTAGLIKQSRASSTPQPVSLGDSTFNCTWSPQLNTTNYEVRVMFITPDAAATTYYGWRVVDASRTTSGVTIRLDNMKAGWQIAWVVQEI